jgi:hypothetical protein
MYFLFYFYVFFSLILEDRNKESNEDDGDVEFVERDVDIDETNKD